MWAFWRRKPVAKLAHQQIAKAVAATTPSASSAGAKPGTTLDPLETEVERLREKLQTRPEDALAVIRKWLRQESDRTLH